MKRIRLATLTMATLLAVLNPLTSEAQTNLSISIDPILEDTQKDDIQSYFYRITSGPSYAEDLQFLVRNKSKADVDVTIYPVNSLTSTSGVIDYRVESEIAHSKIADNKSVFTNYATIDKTSVSLEPGEAEVVTMKVNVPELKGTMLGGLGFKIEEETKMDSKSNFQIKQESVNVIATLITDSKPAINKVLQYGDITVEKSPRLYNIILPTSLESKSLITKATVFYKVKDASGKLLFESPIIDNYNFTPDANVNLKLPWLGKVLEEGEKYTLKGQFQYVLDGEEIVAPFSKTFKANGISEGIIDIGMPSIIEDNSSLLLLLSILSLPFLFFLLFMRNREYALYSDESLSPKLIKEKEEKEIYDSVVAYKKSDERKKEYYFIHIYKKSKKEYKYSKTIATDKPRDLTESVNEELLHNDVISS